jgi:transposase-like protein
MRLEVRFPQVDLDDYQLPEACPYGCGGSHYRPHGTKGEPKALRDISGTAAVAYRYACVRCGRTFREYPQGVRKGAQQSDRLRAMTVLLYVLGLSYGAVEDFLTALGCGVAKTTVYNNVQAAGKVARRKQQAQVQAGGKRAVIGADGTFVKVKGASVEIEVVVDDRTGELLGLDIITSENHEEVRDVIQGVVDVVAPEVLVTDDHGAYTEVVDALALDHQICRSHVKRNVDAIAQSLDKHLAHPEPLPEGVELTPEQVRTDLAAMQRLVRARPADGEERLAAMYDRYKDVPVPESGTRHSVWYRMRMAVTRLWERWRKLTLDQRRADLDGTNNACERLIGWWIKERYRTMRGYKRTESIRNVVTLTARIGVYRGYYDLADLVA